MTGCCHFSSDEIVNKLFYQVVSTLKCQILCINCNASLQKSYLMIKITYSFYMPLNWSSRNVLMTKYLNAHDIDHILTHCMFVANI